MNIELYKELSSRKVINLNDLAKLIPGSDDLRRYYLKYFLKKGLLEKIRNGVYGVIGLETSDLLANRFEIASKINESSYVSYHGAFEYYGCANQVFNIIYVSSGRRFESFSFDGIFYKFVPASPRPTFSAQKSKALPRVVTIERATVDSLQSLDRTGGFEEFLRCVLLVPSLNEEKLLKELEIFNSSRLYQKTGFVFSKMQKVFHFSEAFLETCKRRSVLSPTFLEPHSKGFPLDKKWKIYAPSDFSVIIEKEIPG